MKKIVITIRDSEIPNIKNLTKLFASAGLIISDVFEFGVIIGSADEYTMKVLKTYKEIEWIDEEKWYDINVSFVKKTVISILAFFCFACENPDAITISKERYQKLLNGDSLSLTYPKKFFLKDCWGCGSINEKQFQIILGSDGHEYIESNEYQSYVLIHSPECIKCKKDTIK